MIFVVIKSVEVPGVSKSIVLGIGYRKTSRTQDIDVYVGLMMIEKSYDKMLFNIFKE